MRIGFAQQAQGRQSVGFEALHKLMLMSETYQQSTQTSPDASPKDPDNHLSSHANRQRLEGEAVRDALLAISGRLNPKMGGPGVILPEVSKVAGGSRPIQATADKTEYTRRSIYLFNRRNLRYRFWKRSTFLTAT